MRLKIVMTVALIVIGMSWIFSAATMAEPAAAQFERSLIGDDEKEGAHITMITGDTIVTATLNNNQTFQDFVKSLPVTTKMTRWEERKYYGRAPTALSSEGQRQSGFSNGDVAYWVPGGSFALFFNENRNQNISDLIIMGKITSSL